MDLVLDGLAPGRYVCVVTIGERRMVRTFVKW
jgi:hypothetical protein